MCGNCLCVGIGYVWVLAMNVYRRVSAALYWLLEIGYQLSADLLAMTTGKDSRQGLPAMYRQ